MSAPGRSHRTGSAGGSRITTGRRQVEPRDGSSSSETRAALSKWVAARGLPQAPRSKRNAKRRS